jgi:hypothetical protein
MGRGKYQTINTFTRSPSPAQIAAYMVVTVDVVVFYVMIQQSFNDEALRVALIVLFSCSIVGMIIPTILCSAIDPSDTVMVECKQGKGEKYTDKFNELLYCDFCQEYVKPGSRHCRQCDRCVEHFDHHCMWINNCVGSKNYRPFAFTIATTFFHLLLFIFSTIFLTLEDQWQDFLYFIIPTWIVMAVISVLSILLLNLILLHIYLNCKGYTTYQFIMVRKEQEKQEE